MFEYKVSYTRCLEDDEVKDILTTAIEGGIGYWACLGNDDTDWIDARNSYKETHNEWPCYCDVAFDLLNNNKCVVFYDEQDDNKKLLLDKHQFIIGCQSFEEHKGCSIKHMLEDGDFDAWDADAIIQYALFGDVIYG